MKIILLSNLVFFHVCPEDGNVDASFALDDPQDDDGDVVFDLNDPPLEHDNGITGSSLVHLLPCHLFLSIVSHIKRTIVTGFDLNLPLDEFGAIDLDYLQNFAGT
jgi:hypothetical protein